MTTKWLGLWAQERQGFYAGQVVKKADIPAHTRKKKFTKSFTECKGITDCRMVMI